MKKKKKYGSLIIFWYISYSVSASKGKDPRTKQ